MKWTVFAIAPDQVTAEMWCEMLRASRVNCRVRDINPAFLGPSPYPVRLVAPDDECELALQLLEENVELGPENIPRVDH
jgi:hypothetical protein